MEFVEKFESEGKQVVVFKYAALYAIGRWPVLGLLAASFISKTQMLQWIAIGALGVLVLINLALWPATSQVKKAMKTKDVRGSGNRYSFKDPLRFEWELADSKSV